MRKAIMTSLSSLYRSIVLATQASYRKIPSRIKKVNARVISIGNITWGGTGKTPMVIALARYFLESGKKVVVLTRGYGKDEVEELKKNLPQVPVIVGRDRVKTAVEAVQKHGAEIILLDDGFQHIRLHRDMDVVNINSTVPFGPGGLIPLGTLREPIENLARAHIFVLTKSDIGSKNLHWIRQKITSIKPGAVIFEAVHKPVQLLDYRRNRFLPLTEIRGKKVAVISGIGDPYSFEKTVEKIGGQILFAARFDDHHDFTPKEIDEFLGRCKEMGVKDIVTTEKDFARIEKVMKAKKQAQWNGYNFLTLQIEFQMHDEEDFFRRCLNS